MSGAPELEFAALAPLAFTAIGAMLVLLGEVLLSRAKSFLGRPLTDAYLTTLLGFFSIFWLILAGITAAQGLVTGSSEVFNLGHPMMRVDTFANFAILLIALGAILTCALSVTYLTVLHVSHGEYFALLLLATGGMILMVSAVDLMSLFLGLELMSIPIYALAGFARRDLRSNESALKYFITGSFASALMLYGMALVYGTTGHTSFEGIRAAFDLEGPVGLAGLALLLVGFAFKISAVPFHQWTPDVYEGAPTSVTGYMSVAVKATAFAALIRILLEAFPELQGRLEPVLWVLAVLTVVVGNVMAVVQEDVKRLLAYSSVAHAGYLLIGMVAGTPEAIAGVLFYLLVYTFMNLGAFGVVASLAQQGRDCELIEDFAGLARQSPGLASVMTLFLVSLAGIPGTAGFVAKFLVFAPAVKEGQVVLAVIGVLASVVSVYYYLRIPVVMWMRDPAPEAVRPEPSGSEWMVLTLCAAAVLVLGVFPDIELLEGQPLLDLARRSAALLFG